MKMQEADGAWIMRSSPVRYQKEGDTNYSLCQVVDAKIRSGFTCAASGGEVVMGRTMNVPFKLPFLIRGLAKTATTVTLVNVTLVAAWLIPSVTPFIAMAFTATYLYSFIIGGAQNIFVLNNRQKWRFLL